MEAWFAGLFSGGGCSRLSFSCTSLFPIPLTADSEAVDEQIWTFTRDRQRLEIRRTPADEGILLGIHGDDPPRTTFFTDIDRLASFQHDFEAFLLATGWTFESFSPDRRRGRERRHFSRLLTDRRRWWTDGDKTREDGLVARAREERRHRRSKPDRKPL
jgi:hypothetical protein